MNNVEFGRGEATVQPQNHIHHPFQFRGNGKEFFGIWIVNILLTIVTLGIYSAWAKVRTKRYFNGNTMLAGHSFDYHANPVAILKGRIVVILVLIALNFLSQINIFIGLAVFAIYAVGLPWVIIRGLRFNANMTSYRNIRFHFKGKKWEAFKAYIMWPILAVLTLGALYPFVSRANVRFLAGGHSFGRSAFSTNIELKPIYRALGIAFLIAIIPIIAAAAYFIYFISSGYGVFESTDDTFRYSLEGLLPTITIFLTYLALFIAVMSYTAHVRNLSFDSLGLQSGHQFRSTVTTKSYAWITITNSVLIILTVGLFIPWAKVRMAHYLADNTAMIANGDLDQFTAGQVDDSGVASGEFLDIEGIDFGL